MIVTLPLEVFEALNQSMPDNVQLSGVVLGDVVEISNSDIELFYSLAKFRGTDIADEFIVAIEGAPTKAGTPTNGLVFSVDGEYLGPASENARKFESTRRLH